MFKFEYFAGLDPGLEGAIVVLEKTGKYVEHYKFQTLAAGDSKRKLAIYPIFLYLESLMKRLPPTFLTIERIHGSAGQSASSIFSMGYSLGIVEALAAVSGLKYNFVSPQKWKNKMLSGMPKSKDASVQKVLELDGLMSASIIGPRGGRDHNIADAYLIAEYARLTT